jgi:hypothetical protein
VIFVGAADCGMRLFRILVEGSSDWERFVFGGGLGLGALSLLVLLLAHLGTVFLSGLFVACAVSVFMFRRELHPFPSLPSDSLSRFVVGLIVVFFLLSLTMCFLPPRDYDVLEYHLGAPAEYMREGRMHFLPHNVYASFPGNMEMLYLLALGAGHDLSSGAAIAKVLNLLVITLAAAAVFCLGREHISERAGLLAAAALFVHPLTTYVAADPYVEGGLMLYTVLALHAAVSFVRTGSRGWVPAAGISAGLAAGCKYTAVIFVAVPVLLFLLAATGNRKGLAAAALAACCCVGTFLPWAARNVVNTRNPVYPLAYRVFGGGGWDNEQDARFSRAHRPPEDPDVPGVRGFVGKLLDFLAHGSSGSPFLLVFVPLALVLARDRKTTLALGFFLLCYGMWYLATHRIDRFMLPAIPILCLLGGIGADRAGLESAVVRFAAAATLAGSAALTAASEHVRLGSVNVAFGLMPEKKWLQDISKRTTYSVEAVDYMNGMEGDPRILLVGEAEVFHIEKSVVYSVVFSDSAIEGLLSGGSESCPARLREEGITHIFVNWCELQRLRVTYAYEYEGKKRPGYLPDMKVQDVLDIVERLPLENSWGSELGWSFLASKHRMWELYRVRSGSE